MHNFEYKTSVPFVRWLFPNDSKDLESAIKGRGVLPEILLAITLLLTFNSWSQTTQNITSVSVYLLWSLVVVLLFTLALTNIKTMLLPNKLLKPIALAIVVLHLIVAVHTGSGETLGNAVLGGLAVGGFLYLLFQVSAGRWLGGGDVKLGFLAGLLLGWKAGLFCLGVMVGLVVLSFLVEYVTSKLSKTHTPALIPTGVLWVTAIMISVVIGQQLLK